MEDFTHMTTEEWANHLATPTPPLPAMPPVEVQIATAARSGIQTMREACDFYSAVRERRGAAIRHDRILDFGCGWGRITRTFLKETPASHITGVDARPDAVEMATRLAPMLTFLSTKNEPPLPNVGRIDVIVAYSVFSHLPESLATAWLAEFARVLPAGGLVAVTTRSRNWLENNVMASKIGARVDRLAAYDQGEFLFGSIGGAGPNLPGDAYGEAVIPEAYVRSHWNGNQWDFIGYDGEYSAIAQQPIIFLVRR